MTWLDQRPWLWTFFGHLYHLEILSGDFLGHYCLLPGLIAAFFHLIAAGTTFELRISMSAGKGVSHCGTPSRFSRRILTDQTNCQDLFFVVVVELFENTNETKDDAARHEFWLPGNRVVLYHLVITWWEKQLLLSLPTLFWRRQGQGRRCWIANMNFLNNWKDECNHEKQQ